MTKANTYVGIINRYIGPGLGKGTFILIYEVNGRYFRPEISLSGGGYDNETYLVEVKESEITLL